MTEKRFTFADGFKIVAIRDNGEIMNSRRVCDKLNELYEENEQLKHFIQELTTKGTGKIHLANGNIYKVNAILTDFKR